MNRILKIALLPIGLWSGISFAGFNVDILPPRMMDLNNVVITSRTTASTTGNSRININLSCYATNLRGTPNPLAETSTVLGYFDYVSTSGALQTIIIEFPATMVAPTGSMAPVAVGHNTASILPGVKVTGAGNTITIEIPDVKTATINPDGSVDTSQRFGLNSLQSVRFDQVGAPGGAFVGMDGPLSASLNWSSSVDSHNIEVTASFPGAAGVGQQARYLGETRTGFCGGWYSPLMLFVDAKRPTFSGKSKFKLSSGSPEVYWVEPNAPGYFLAQDKDKNGKIDNGAELFGDNLEQNGFAALAKFDSNSDGIIDKNDKIFKDLLLWQDKNGDGVSQKAELSSLSKLGIHRIELTVEKVGGTFGERAMYSDQSKFEFKSKGKVQTGTVLDMYFKPTLK